MVHAPTWLDEYMYSNSPYISTSLFVYSNTPTPDNIYKYPRIDVFSNAQIVSNSYRISEECYSGDTVSFGNLYTKQVSIQCKYPGTSYKNRFVKIKQEISNGLNSFTIYPVVGYISDESVDDNNFLVTYTIVDMVTLSMDRDVSYLFINPTAYDLFAPSTVFDCFMLANTLVYVNQDVAPGKSYIPYYLVPGLLYSINYSGVFKNNIPQPWKYSDFLKSLGEYLGCNFRISKRTYSSQFSDDFIYPGAESFIEMVFPNFDTSLLTIYPSSTLYPSSTTYPTEELSTKIPWYMRGKFSERTYIGPYNVRFIEDGTVTYENTNVNNLSRYSYVVENNIFYKSLSETSATKRAFQTSYASKLMNLYAITGHAQLQIPIYIEAGDFLTFDDTHILKCTEISTSGSHFLQSEVTCNLTCG